MRRFPVVLLLCGLLTATGLALTGLAATISITATPSLAEQAESRASAALVHEFYAAINHAIRNPDSAKLDAIVAPDFVAYGAVPRAVMDHAAFRDYLIALHASYPSLQLTVKDLVAGEEAVVVRLHVHGGERGKFASAGVVGSDAPWGTTNSFRVRNGEIVEIWGQGGSVPLSLFAVDIPGPPSGTVSITLDRLRLADGTGGVPPVDRWPRLLWIEAGNAELSVRPVRAGTTPRPVTITRATAGQHDAAEIVPHGSSTGLAVGDVAVIPGGVDYDLIGLGDDPVVALGMSIHPADLIDEREIAVDPRVGDAATFHPPRELTGWPLGAAVEHVASWFDVGLPVGTVKLTAGQLQLAPGARLELDSAASRVAIATQNGALAVTAERGFVSVSRPHDGTTPRLSYAADERIGPGDGLWITPDRTVALSASGTIPAGLLVFVLAPAQR